MATKTKHNHKADTKGVTSTVATTDDGTIQITFAIPTSLIESEEVHVLEEFQKNTKIPGFRPGKAPLAQVKAKTDPAQLLEHTLQHILPHAFTDVVVEKNLRPAIYPRFEILSDTKDSGLKTWQVRATTCAIPDVKLGDYKKIASEAIATKAKEPELTREEKEGKLLEALIKEIEVVIPKLLIEEEVNSRLSQLLERIEKLGLNLDSYLSSLNKKVDELRSEYETQAKQAISLEFILNAIADKEEIKVSDEEVEKAMTAAGSDASQKRMVSSILRRRAVLDSLIGKS